MPLQVNDRGFVFDPEKKIWVPPLNRKQLEIFNAHQRYLLIHGPRKSGKTFGVIHKVIKHNFDVNAAMFAIITKTIKNAKSAGVWVLLTRMLKLWEEGCPGFRVVEGPKTTGDSKMSFVRILNRWGTVSEIQCHSLEYSSEVEAKFKGPSFSGFWLSEFDQYCDEYAFDILCDALRGDLWRYEDYQIICDCNPPDTGTDNWIHDKWFKFKDATPDKDDDGSEQELRNNLHRILVNIEDNPQLDERERRDLVARYKKRKALYNRFILGIWEQDITDGHFSDVWDESVHVVGNADGPKDEWEVLVPTSDCRELITGWDLGEKKSHSFHILEKIIYEHEGQVIVGFNVIDEIVVVDQFVSIEDFTVECLEKMDHWENYVVKNFQRKPSWRHWSDTSAFELRTSSNDMDAAIVYNASKGKIILQGAPKYRDSNRDKVKLLWQLLFTKRLIVSASCFSTRKMFSMLRPSPGSAVSKYVKRDNHKHPFDSLSYAVMSEAPVDMFRSAEIDPTAKESAPRPVFANF